MCLCVYILVDACVRLCVCVLQEKYDKLSDDWTVILELQRHRERMAALFIAKTTSKHEEHTSPYVRRLTYTDVYTYTSPWLLTVRIRKVRYQQKSWGCTPKIL